uniref:Uncharacterized protein n=1 Tax=Romanomermis culicivorax TaxID=13658 RepID=A0A915KF06_ROMCU
MNWKQKEDYERKRNKSKQDIVEERTAWQVSKQLFFLCHAIPQEAYVPRPNANQCGGHGYNGDWIATDLGFRPRQKIIAFGCYRRDGVFSETTTATNEMMCQAVVNGFFKFTTGQIVEKEVQSGVDDDQISGE